MTNLVQLPAPEGTTASRAIPMGSLDQLMPLHLQLREPGIVTHMAPTLRKLVGSTRLLHRNLFDHWEFRRPEGITQWIDLIQCENVPLIMRSELLSEYALRGILVPFAGHGGYILDLSLGVGVCQAISQKALKIKDFSPADSTAEMVYMVEAQSVMLDAARSLNQRLHGKKVRLEEQAFTDSLTGLKNRRALVQYLNRMATRLNRPVVALLQLDLDFFKEVNDSFGHAAGDLVLKEVGVVLKAQIRRNDIVARMGGDEFVVAITGVSEPEVLAEIANRIIDRLSAPIAFEDQLLKVGASIGGTIIPVDDPVNVEDAIGRADSALYQSKEAGRGCFTFLTSKSKASLGPA